MNVEVMLLRAERPGPGGGTGGTGSTGRTAPGPCPQDTGGRAPPRTFEPDDLQAPAGACSPVQRRYLRVLPES